jgi:hypothetical protein
MASKKKNWIRETLEADLRFNGCPQSAEHVLGKFDAVYDDHAEKIGGMSPSQLAGALVNSASGLGSHPHPFLK